MSILRFQNSNISVVTQQKGNFCWAACIEMVTHKYHKNIVTNQLQCHLAQKQVQLLSNAETFHFDIANCLSCSDLGDTSLAEGDDLYIKLFKEICQISCTQVVSADFPDWSYIETHASNDSPVIFSGLYVPSCFGARHAVVVTGCFLEKTEQGEDIHWVLANDPYAPNPCQGEKARKTAWIYDELKNSHKKVSTELDDTQPLSYVADFNRSKKFDSSKKVAFAVSERKGGSYPTVEAENLKEQITLVLKSLFDNENDTALHDHFGFSNETLIELTTIGAMAKCLSINASDILKITTDDKDFIAIGNDSNISRLPIYQAGKPIIDICIQHEEDGTNRILGIEECQKDDKLNTASVSIKGIYKEIIEFNHDAPNYTIVDIAPFGFRFMVFEWAGDTCWAPVVDYPSIDCHCKISLRTSELMELLKKKLPAAHLRTKPHSY